MAKSDWGEEHDHERGDAQKRAEWKLILAGDGPAEIAHRAEIAAAGPFGKGKLPPGSVEPENDRAADDASEECAEKNREKRAAQAEKRADHGHHLHVAHAHAFAAAPQFVERGDAPEQQAAECRAKQSVKETEQIRRRNSVEHRGAGPEDDIGVSRRHGSGKKEADDKAGPVDDIGQEADAKIGDGQHHDEAGENEPLRGGGGEPVFEIAQDKKAAGSELDQRVHRRNRESAGAAFTAQPEPAEHGDVVVRLDRGLAAGATRTRGHDGQTLWNPRDADVQKAAKNDAEEKKEGDDHRLTVP